MSNLLKTALAAGAIAIAAALPAQAQLQTPMIEFHTQLYDMHGTDHSFHFLLGAVEDTYVDIDFGYGPMEYKIGQADFDMETGAMTATTISGQVGPEGVVKIYGNPLLIDYVNFEGIYADELDISQLINLDILEVSHNLLPELDLSAMRRLQAVYVEDNPFDRKPFLLGPNHPELTILSMPNIGALDQSFSLTDYPNLQSFDAYSTKDLRVCDPTKCPKLLQISIDCTNVETIDVSQNPELRILNVSQSKVTELDLSNNPELVQLYLTNYGTFNTEYKFKKLDVSKCENLTILAAAGNELTDLDVSWCPALFHLTVQHNLLPGIDLSGNPDLYTVDVSMNRMDFVTLPPVEPYYGEYYYYQQPLEVARSFPVGAELDMESRLNRPKSTTTAKLMCGDEELGDEYYTYSDGLIEFYKATPDSVYFAFNNTDFEAYGLETNKFVVKEVADFGKDNAVVTWRLKPAAKTVTLSVGIAGASPENPKRFSVDFGDGNPVDYTTTTNLLGTAPVLTVDKKNAGAMTLYIPEGEELTALSLSDTPLSTIDLTAAHSVTDLEVKNCTLSNIDLRWNRRIRNLNVDDNNLETLDLKGYDDTWIKTSLNTVSANNNALTEFIGNEYHSAHHVELANNQLDDFDLSKCSNLEYLDISNNKLTLVNLQDCEALTYLNAAGNDLAELEILDYVPLTTLNITNNRFPLSTLPLPGVVKDYAYAPQKEWMMPDKAPSIDLSRQEITVDGNSTVFTWHSAADGSVLTDEQVRANGAKFRFLDPEMGEVYATWTNAAFPQFRGADVYRSANVLAAEAPTHVAASFTTLEAVSTSIVLRAVDPNSYVYIDWAGDGDLTQYPLDHTTYTVFPVETYENADVKVYTYDERDGIGVFSFSNVPMKNVDLSTLTDVYALFLSNDGLSANEIKMPTTSLRELNMGSNDVSGMDFSIYPDMYMMNLCGCGLKEFDATPFKKLNLLYLSGNELTKLTLDNPVLWNLDAGANQLEELDLNSVPKMRQLYLGGNQFSTIDVSKLSELKILVLSGNKFTLTTLPRVLSTYSSYDYSNQALYPVTVKDGATIDLSKELMVGTNRTDYRWFRDKNVGYYEDGTIGGDELEPGTDYSVEDGVFTFFGSVKDAVCVMTNVAFPNAIFLTDPVDIQGTGVEGVADDAAALFVAVAADGTITVSGAKGEVALYALDGRMVDASKAIDGGVTFTGVAPGAYVIFDGMNVTKVLVK